MHTSSLPHGAGMHRRLAVLAVAVTAVAVVAGVTLADLRAPASTETAASAAATDEALALAARRHHAPLAEAMVGSEAPLLILGETGVGKGVLARWFHERGTRAAEPFVDLNCAGLSRELAESELFGYGRGAFTGAASNKAGLIEVAHKGTLFLDEVAELPIQMQVKLLRVIQEKAVRPIGGRAEVPVDVRILSATHKNLAKLVEANQFRQDLFYRINVIELRVPPLRERREDVPKLAGRVLERLANDNGQSPARLTPEALAALLTYAFPGNVRELENVLERAVALCENNTIKPDDLRLSPQTQAASAVAARVNDNGEDDGEDDGDATGDGGLDSYISNLEREAIMKALQETRYNKTAAAKKLGITFRALRYKLKKLGID